MLTNFIQTKRARLCIKNLLLVEFMREKERESEKDKKGMRFIKHKIREEKRRNLNEFVML